MCISLYPAVMSNTVLYAGDAYIDGKTIHVLGYQNTVDNKNNGPNAMVIPFPASAPMGPDNVVDTSNAKDVLRDFGTMFMHNDNSKRRRSFTLNLKSVDSVQVFESGNYTVVLSSNDASLIPAALEKVPENRRPAVNQAMFDKFAELYPEWPIALCCFDNSQMIKANPMVWWYEPKNPNELFAPALDAHDGSPPDTDAIVKVDHTVVFGVHNKPLGRKAYHVDKLPNNVRPYFSNWVQGQKFDKIFMPNGDFIVDKKEFLNSTPDVGVRGLRRAAP